MTIEFFMPMKNPPTTTAQMKQVSIANGRPVFYEPPAVKRARAILRGNLAGHKPVEPLTGPIGLSVMWLFPAAKAHRDGEWRVTRPDTDNLQKMLKDCMTACGFWKDDAQVVWEKVEKRWTTGPSGILIAASELVEDGYDLR